MIESCDQGAEAPAGQYWVATTTRILRSSVPPRAFYEAHLLTKKRRCNQY